MLIREMAPTERPAYRLAVQGPEYLSDAELLTALVGKPDLEWAQAVLAEYNLSELMTMEPANLKQLLGRRASLLLSASMEIGRRGLAARTDKYQIRSPADAARLVADMASLDVEHLRVICLSTKNHVLKVETVYRGSVNTALIRAAEILRKPLMLNCPALMLAHNHPSGEPDPSPEDILMTRAIREAARLLDLDLLDHIIVGRATFVSMRERGLGFG